MQATHMHPCMSKVRGVQSPPSGCLFLSVTPFLKLLTNIAKCIFVLIGAYVIWLELPCELPEPLVPPPRCTM